MPHARKSNVWKMQDAKAQFSEVVRRARKDGPQRVTHRGEDAVVVVRADEFDRVAGPRETGAALIDFFRNSPLRDLDFEVPRVRSPVRDPEFP